MNSRMSIFLMVFVAIFASALSLNFLNNPSFASLRGVVRNEEAKLASGLMADVRRMQIKNPFSSMLLRGQPIVNKPKPVVDTQLQNPFNWTSCGPANQMMEIKSLFLKPSPLSFPGTLSFGFDLVFHDNIKESDQVEAALELSYKTGGGWIKFPCVGNIGSCTYKDLCSQLNALTCPAAIKQQGVPCHCPFNKGEYKLKEYSVDVLAEVFISGDYKATANLTSPTKGHVGCYQIFFSVD